MACVREKFKAIRLEPIKKKYYSIHDVDALLEDLQAFTLGLAAENEELQKRVGELTRQKTEVAEAIVSAKTIAQKIIADAHERGLEIIDEAEEKKRELSIRIDAVERRFTRRLIQCVNEMNDELFERGIPEREHPDPTTPAPFTVTELPKAPVPAAAPVEERPAPATAPSFAVEAPAPAFEPEEAPAPAAAPENLPDDLYRRLEEIADSLLAIEDKT